jgi:hypothetical protein
MKNGVEVDFFLLIEDISPAAYRDLLAHDLGSLKSEMKI